MNHDNIIHIKFYDKKNFLPGPWNKEPDYCEWVYRGQKCLALRNMEYGFWQGFVGITSDHPAFNKQLTDIFNEKWGLCVLVHGGLCMAGKLPSKYKDLNKKYWWFGFSCCQAEDIIPIEKSSDPEQSYKNFSFVRSEVQELIDQLFNLQVLWEP